MCVPLNLDVRVSVVSDNAIWMHVFSQFSTHYVSDSYIWSVVHSRRVEWLHMCTLWQRRLGHLGSEALSKLISSQAITCTKPKNDNVCHACQLGRHVRLPFDSSQSRPLNKFDLIHCDLWTSPVTSMSGEGDRDA